MHVLHVHCILQWNYIDNTMYVDTCHMNIIWLWQARWASINKTLYIRVEYYLPSGQCCVSSFTTWYLSHYMGMQSSSGMQSPSGMSVTIWAVWSHQAIGSPSGVSVTIWTLWNHQAVVSHHLDIVVPSGNWIIIWYISHHLDIVEPSGNWITTWYVSHYLVCSRHLDIVEPSGNWIIPSGQNIVIWGHHLMYYPL